MQTGKVIILDGSPEIFVVLIGGFFFPPAPAFFRSELYVTFCGKQIMFLKEKK